MRNSSRLLRLQANEEAEHMMISDLPDDIRCQILSLLPIKHAVATTLLSKNWNNLWTYASFTNLELDDRLLLHQESPKMYHNHYASLFSAFVNNVLRLIRLPCVRRLAFFCSDTYHLKELNSWLLIACTSDVVEVEIRISYTENPIELPQILYVSTSLLVLKLNANLCLDSPSDSLCFPSLKVLWIKVYNQDGVSFAQKLLNLCLVLEDLFIQGKILNKEHELIISVKSSTLKRLKIEFSVENFNGDIGYSFVVDCPNLEHIDLHDDFLAKYKISTDLKAIEIDDAKICIGDPSADYGAFELYFEVKHSNRAFELLEALSNVKSLCLSGGTTKAVSYSYDNVDQTENALQMRLKNFMLKFPFLTRLELGFCTCESWKLLTLLLHSCPKLEFLFLRKELKERFSFKMPEGSMPECLLLCLQEIEIWGFEGGSGDLTVAEYFLYNAEVLQKMTIHVEGVSPEKEMMLRDHVLEIPKISEDCLVEIQFKKRKKLEMIDLSRKGGG